MNQIKNPSKEKYWQKQVEKYSKTSMSQRAFCRNNGISYWSFNTWKRRLSENSVKKDMVEVPAKKVRGVSKVPSKIELEINQSIRVFISSGFDPDLLKNVISALVADQ